VPYFICPNCKRRVIDADRREGLTHQPVGCTSCGFGFLFELLEDYYPGPNTGFIVCDPQRRVIAIGRGVLELSGYREQEVLGHEVMEAFGLRAEAGDDPAALSLEWGVRRLGQKLTMRMRSGTTRPVVGDFFPAYDEDGGLLVALSPVLTPAAVPGAPKHA
jgi:PAS domain-containing protein